MPIRTPDQRLRVFVSSTMRELADERVAVRGAVERLRLTPVLFELGARPHPPRELYLAYLQQSDVFVGVYWQSYGWVAPGQSVSGLEDEYLAAAGKPKLVYLKTPAPDRDPRLVELIDRIGSDGLSYRSFGTAEELAVLVADDLALLLSERFELPEPPPAGEPIGQWRLPAPVSSFIGREQELTRLRGVLSDAATRLVTLVGPGGIGKTRLAVQVAAEVRGSFPDGVVAVPLDSVRAPELLADAVATALGLPDGGGRFPEQALAAFLAPRRMLLVLDNMEQVVGGAPLITQLLGAAPGLTVLATSREVLHLTGEHVVVVPSLGTVGAEEPIDVLARSEAVRLFVDRARSARADVDLDDDQLRAIAEICRRLDGLPLAIELAAARVRLLQPVELLGRLGSRLGVLTGGSRDLPERQRTLRRTVEWSFDLLDDDDEVVVARLAVFRGGFSLEGAEAVCGDEQVSDVLSSVASLVDKSLVQVAPGASGEPRFAMLDSVRELALERLEASGEADQVRGDHARFFLRFAAGVHTAERGALDRSTLDRYVTESGNLGAAMRTFLDGGALDEAAGLGRALWQFWWVHGLLRPGIDWMEELLAHQPHLTPAVRADASFVLGMLSFELGEEGRALPALRTAVELSGELGDDRSASLARIPLGLLVARSDTAAGEGLLEAAVAALRELGDRWGLAFALLSLGGAKLLRDLPDDAVPLLEESAALARTAGTDVFLGNALVNLGLAHTARGDLDTAHRVLSEALERSRSMDSRETTARALDGMAAEAVAAGEPERAARLTGAADGIRRSIGADVFPPDRTGWVRTRAALAERLGAADSAALIHAEADRPVRDLLTERW
ncbi:ATP-binding protein [Geodermatophilus sp. SYSU D00710]